MIVLILIICSNFSNSPISTTEYKFYTKEEAVTICQEVTKEITQRSLKKVSCIYREERKI